MASIVERNNSVSVVYYYEDEDGTKKQKWETVKKDQIDAASVAALTEKRKKERTKSAKRTAASARKTEVEFTQRKGTFIIPKKVTVREFLVDFVSLGIPGVFVAYQNFREPMRIHLGSRLQETEQITGRVSSVCGLHFASYEGGRFVMNSNPGNVTLKELSAPRKPSGLKAVSSDVVAITAHTALDYGFYCCGGRTPAAYIIKLYHSGTCCNASGKYGAASFIERAKESGAEVVLAPFTGGTPYAGSAEIYKRALLAVDTSFEMCIAKVMLALGSGKDISEVLSENYAFEKLSKR